jgi:hypothetical protein
MPHSKTANSPTGPAPMMATSVSRLGEDIGAPLHGPMGIAANMTIEAVARNH